MTRYLVLTIILAGLAGCGDATTAEDNLDGLGGRPSEPSEPEPNPPGDNRVPDLDIIETVDCPSFIEIHEGREDIRLELLESEDQIDMGVALSYQSPEFEGEPMSVRLCHRFDYELGMPTAEDTGCIEVNPSTFLDDEGGVRVDCALLIWERGIVSTTNPMGIYAPTGHTYSYAEITW